MLIMRRIKNSDLDFLIEIHPEDGFLGGEIRFRISQSNAPLIAAIFLGTGNRSRELFCPIVASMFVKLKRNLEKSYRDILG